MSNSHRDGSAGIQRSQRDDAGLAFECNGTKVRIDVVAPNVLRVRATRESEYSTRPSRMVLPQSGLAVPWELHASDSALEVRTTRLTLRIDRARGAFTWLDVDGELLVREPERGGKHLDPVKVEKRIFDTQAPVTTESTADGVKVRAQADRVVVDRTAYRTRLELVFSEGEALYGLGQHEEGILNYRGHWQALYQQNLKVAMPVLLSTRGYGIFWDTCSLALFHDDAHGSYFHTDVDDELEFFFVAGPELDAIVGSLRKLTGHPTLFPRWAFGYIQSKEAYRTQEEVVEVARGHRERGIPLDCVVQDWRTWQGDLWGDKTPDPARYPDVPGFVRALHAMNVRLMVSIWPHVSGDGADRRELMQHGFLLGNGSTYDAFNPDARALYWRQVERGWARHGVDAWWCDCTEPFEADWTWDGSIKLEPWERIMRNTQEAKKYLDPEDLNAYSMLHAQGIYEHQRAAAEHRRVVNVTRSALPGQQRYGAITWSGDTSATWSTLRQQIADGLNFCATGNPKWHLDIGGFFTNRQSPWFWRGDFPEGCTDEGYRELYVRWFQLGVFLPMFRAHGTDTPREIWRFGAPGEPVYDTLVHFVRLRYRLLPYIYSVAARETLDGYTMFRLLAFDFRSDARVHDIADQFMFGPALMVCPVTHPMAFGPGSTALTGVPKTREVYLPVGCDWYDFWTGERHRGGQTIQAWAPLERVPVFVRAGSLLPLGPDVQHAGERPDDPVELRVYPGRDGTFSLYFDENDGHGYERGAFERFECSWSDGERTLRLGERRGTYPGQPNERVVRAVIVRETHGVGTETCAAPDHEVVCARDGHVTVRPG